MSMIRHHVRLRYHPGSHWACLFRLFWCHRSIGVHLGHRLASSGSNTSVREKSEHVRGRLWQRKSMEFIGILMKFVKITKNEAKTRWYHKNFVSFIINHHNDHKETLWRQFWRGPSRRALTTRLPPLKFRWLAAVTRGGTPS